MGKLRVSTSDVADELDNQIDSQTTPDIMSKEEAREVYQELLSRLRTKIECLNEEIDE